MCRLFLGDAQGSFVTDHAHDVSLLPRLVDRVAHRLAVDGEALIFLAESRVPLLQGEVEPDRIDPHQHIAEDGLAGNDITFLYVAAAKAFARLGFKVFRPCGDSLVAAHAAQGCASRDAEHNAEPVASAFGAARVWDVVKEVGQRAHLFGSQHDLGFSGTINRVEDGPGELGPRITLHGEDKGQFGRFCIRAVALAGAAEPPRQPQASPVGGAIDRAVEARRINESFQQEQGLSKTFLPVPGNSLMAQ